MHENPDDTGKRVLRKVVFSAGDEYDPANNGEVSSLEEATIISSDLNDGSELHLPVIDIDLPIKVIPSSTEGHFHLYIDYPLGWDEYQSLLDVMAEVGLVQPGYVAAAKRRGHTDVRLPWVHKKEPEPLSDDDLPGMWSRSDFL